MNPAAITAQEYTHRRAYLAREVAAGRMARTEAEQRLTPWLHLAAICGAEVPGTVEDGLHLYPWDKAAFGPFAAGRSLSLEQAREQLTSIGFLKRRKVWE